MGESEKVAVPGQSSGPERELASPAALDPERWVEEHGDILFGFALGRVGDVAAAQDLVQETFLAALRGTGGFAGRSTERAWLFGILRNKLVDYHRRQLREVLVTDWEAVLPEEQGAFGEAGLGKDGWLRGLGPKAWPAPDQDLVSKEFQGVLKGCLEGLPEKVAQCFWLREVEGAESEEICKDLGISANHLWVMLHRARMGLRRCLEVNWFGKKHS